MIEGVRQWAFALVLTAMAGGIATAVSNSQSIKKYIKFACALVALAVMIAPISSLFRGLPDIFRQGGVPEIMGHEPELSFELSQLIIDKSGQMLEQRISAEVEQKIGIKPENIYIYSNINNTGTGVHIRIEKIIINMPEGSDIDTSAVQAYLKEVLGSEVVIE